QSPEAAGSDCQSYSGASSSLEEQSNSRVRLRKVTGRVSNSQCRSSRSGSSVARKGEERRGDESKGRGGDGGKGRRGEKRRGRRGDAEVFIGRTQFFFDGASPDSTDSAAKQPQRKRRQTPQQTRRRHHRPPKLFEDRIEPAEHSGQHPRGKK